MPITITDISQLNRLGTKPLLIDEILPDPWDDREKRLRAFHFTQNIYKKNIVNLSSVLNKYHNVNFSTRYWSIVCGPWFRVFINRLYHFWVHFESVEIAFSASIELPNFELQNFVANDQKNFYEISRSKSWNQFVIGQLAKRRGIKVHLVKTGSLPVDYKLFEQATGGRPRVLATINKILDLLSRKKVLITASNLTNWHKLKLMFSLRERLYFLEHELSLPVFDYDLNERQSLVRMVEQDTKIESKFEEILLELAMLHIPKPFIEGFDMCNSLWLKSDLPEKPSVILTGTAIYGNELFKLYSAEKIEKGCKLCIICHGGGAHLYTDFLEHELDICDRYFTWGWEHESPKCVKGFNIQNPVKNKITGKEDSLLMIMTSSQDNTEFLESMPSKKQFRTDYVNDQIKFASTLNGELISKTKVRLSEYSDSFVKKGMVSLFPDLHYIYRGEDLSTYRNDAKILVITYNETSIVEALASNKPTIVFFRPQHFEMNDDGLDVYQELRKVGVFHDTPESAALHVNDIWGNVSGWWNSRAVKDAVRRHNTEFSRTTEQPIKELLSFIDF